jgi:hypothetical protein
LAVCQKQAHYAVIFRQKFPEKVQDKPVQAHRLVRPRKFRVQPKFIQLAPITA